MLLGFNHVYLVLCSILLPVLLSSTAVCNIVGYELSSYRNASASINTQLEQLRLGLDIAHSKIKSIINTQYNVSEGLEELEQKLKNLKLLNEFIQNDITNLFAEKVFNKKENMKTSARNQRSYDENFNSLESYNPIKRASIPSNCAEATIGNNLLEDIYLLNIPSGNTKPFFAYCIHENDNGRAWTIIQRREDGSENFHRNWSNYTEGFGDLYGEYWLGLDRVHAMTVNQPHELWILLEDYEGERAFAKYSKFSIASEEEGFKLTVEGYVGSAGDSLGRHNSMKFSTMDVNNDLVKTNCARKYKGGWWYKNCYDCNLNGIFYTLSNHKTDYGINWNAWHGHETSLRYTHMAIRPV